MGSSSKRKKRRQLIEGMESQMVNIRPTIFWMMRRWNGSKEHCINDRDVEGEMDFIFFSVQEVWEAWRKAKLKTTDIDLMKRRKTHE